MPPQTRPPRRERGAHGCASSTLGLWPLARKSQGRPTPLLRPARRPRLETPRRARARARKRSSTRRVLSLKMPPMASPSSNRSMRKAPPNGAYFQARNDPHTLCTSTREREREIRPRALMQVDQRVRPPSSKGVRAPARRSAWPGFGPELVLADPPHVALEMLAWISSRPGQIGSRLTPLQRQLAPARPPLALSAHVFTSGLISTPGAPTQTQPSLELRDATGALAERLHDEEGPLRPHILRGLCTLRRLRALRLCFGGALSTRVGIGSSGRVLQPRRKSGPKVRSCSSTRPAPHLKSSGPPQKALPVGPVLARSGAS